MRYVDRGGMRTVVVPRADFGRQYFALLRQLCEAQNWRCCYCGIHMEFGRAGEWTPELWKAGAGIVATIEHVTPKVQGGQNKWKNLAAACKLCNNGRSDMDYEKYLRFVLWKGREAAAQYAHRLRGKLSFRRYRMRMRGAVDKRGETP